MKIIVCILFIFISCIACKSDREKQLENQKNTPDKTQVFDKEKWQTKTGENYPYRDSMVNDILYNDTIRTLHRNQILELLGEPSYTRNGHLYYRITETRLGNWSVKTKTLVIKLLEDGSIVWIKLHE